MPMDVEIVEFPRTPIALLTHRGPEHLVYETTLEFIKWRQRVGITPDRAQTFGLHYADATPDDYRFEVAVSFDGPVADNPEGVTGGELAAGRCAKVRHYGSREHIPAAEWLYRDWVPQSGEELRDAPFFFHYVNIGPDVRDRDMITDLYLPLK